MDFKGVLSEELEDAPERLLRSLPRPFNPRATHDQPPGILAYTDSCLLWISFEGVARACQGVAIEGVSPTPPVPERKRGLRRAKMAAAAAAAAATEQVCEPAAAEGLGSRVAGSTPQRAGTRARGLGWGGRARRQGGAAGRELSASGDAGEGRVGPWAAAPGWRGELSLCGSDTGHGLRSLRLDVPLRSQKPSG